jgi:uncharacterized metal-binding protein YceD (DUF177 family)
VPKGNEFSRPVVIEPWPDGGIDVELSAEPEECRALARRFDLLEVASLRASGRLERVEGTSEIRFRGRLDAEVVQTCVVSLEPVPVTIVEVVERRYRRADPARSDTKPGGAGLPAEDAWADEDEAEPVVGRMLDLGEALAEELALALEPYPRAEGAATLAAGDLGPYVSFGSPEPPANPFAALEQLKEERAG